MPDLALNCFPTNNCRRTSRNANGLAIGLMFVLSALAPLQAQESFDSVIRPFLQSHCVECHTGADSQGKLDMTEFDNRTSIANRFTDWKSIQRRVSDGSMPPKDSSSNPTDKERKTFAKLSRELSRESAVRLAGDPGLVSVRRLSNAEYNNSIRDLTGVDLRPAKEFPVDPANEAGFDNSGESLSMSTALLNKYLASARSISTHMVLTPTGISFAAHPVATDTDRDKYCVQRIVDFYNKQPTDLADYLFAAWQARSISLADPDLRLERIAKSNQISSHYLATLLRVLNEDEVNTERTKSFPMEEVRRRWRVLPNEDEWLVRLECEAIREFILDVRRQLEPKYNLRLKGIHDGAQAFVLWKNRQCATHRRSFVPDTLQAIDFDKLPADIAGFLRMPEEDALLSEQQQDLELFCKTFPDAFFISERGRDYLGVAKDKQEKGRLLSAGFHSMMGYFRDDQPLYELVLDDAGRLELDQLWQELDFVTTAPIRQYQGFLWFERTDHNFLREEKFDFARPENKEALTERSIEKLSELYLEKTKGMKAASVHLNAITDFFVGINKQIRWVEQTRTSSEQLHVDAIIGFADRASRGFQTPDQRAAIKEVYGKLRRDENLSHEEAIQDLLVSVLMSPEFCYRVDLGSVSSTKRPLNNLELANRLSYFLWSSMPDERLLEKARNGNLSEPSALLAEVDRMLRDDRTRSFATEFGSQWLDFQRFQEHNSVDRTRFPQFTDSLRESMYQEPIRFLVDMIQQNRSVLSCLDANYTFVNHELVKHYGMNIATKVGGGEWWRVTDLPQSDRSGLLTMSVFMTQNAPGLRTSPVKRGYWVIRRLLGEEIPPPPPNVPELPADEAELGELSLRQTLEKHRQLESCAVCHDRFDSIGLAFESYGPIGERRETDLGGKSIDDSSQFPNGTTGVGIDGLREYLMKDRKADFIENLSRKLLAFGLGRTLRLSDELLIEAMGAELESQDYRFGALIKTIVLSPQFLEKRGTSETETNHGE